jgi:hypothetical protein
MAETQQKTWDVLGYTYEEPPGRVYRVGLTRDQIKELREDKDLRAYHMLPALGDTKHETWLRKEHHLPELRRTPSMRSSENFPSTRLGEDRPKRRLSEVT